MTIQASAFSKSVVQIKGIGILLVVLGHIASPFTLFIFSFHIPLFFFVAGIFIHPDDSAVDFFRKNIVRLMVPYFIFSILGWAVNLIKNILLHRSSENILDSFSGLIFWMDAKHLNHYGFVLWFLPALFLSKAIVYCLNKYFPLHKTGIFLACVAIAFFSIHSHLQLPFAIDNAFVALPWVSAGFIFYSYKERLLKISILIPLIAAVTLYLIIDGGLIPVVNMAENNIGDIWISLPYTLLVFFLIFWVMYKINSHPPSYLSALMNFLVFVGAQTMLIYVLHPYTNNGAYLIVMRYFGEGYWYLQFLMTCLFLTPVIWIKLRNQNSLPFRFLA